jgi:hypothetical protein
MSNSRIVLKNANVLKDLFVIGGVSVVWKKGYKRGELFNLIVYKYGLPVYTDYFISILSNKI